MKKYYLSHIDFSEIVNITADEEQLERAKNRMIELELLTEKGISSAKNICTMTADLSEAFFIKLRRRLRYRNGGIIDVRDTLKKLYDRSDYYGFYMYVAFLYGFLEWQVPGRVVLLPAVWEALEFYCTAFLEAFNKFIEDNPEIESEDIETDEVKADI